MKKRIVLATLLVTLFLSMIGSSIYAQALQVQIGVPSNPNDLGITAGSYWVGEFPVTLNPGTSQAVTGEAYCMTSGGTVYEGTSYTATEVPVPNTPTWQQIAYLLSWNAPTTNSQAAIDQVAIWMLMGQNPPYTDFSLDSSITNQATSLVSSLSAGGGMNVVRAGDHLQWISPFVGTEGSANVTSAEPSQPITFQVQVTDSSGQPLAIKNVQIDFTAVSLTTPEYTNSNGVATYTFVVPPGTHAGITLAVTASTNSVWPVEFLDLTTASPGTQNLLGVGASLGLTASFGVNISGYVFALPESAFGALGALVAFAAGFLIYYKLKPQAKQPKL